MLNRIDLNVHVWLHTEMGNVACISSVSNSLLFMLNMRIQHLNNILYNCTESVAMTTIMHWMDSYFSFAVLLF